MDHGRHVHVQNNALPSVTGVAPRTGPRTAELPRVRRTLTKPSRTSTAAAHAAAPSCRRRNPASPTDTPVLLHEQPAVGRRSGRRLFLATAMAAAAWGSSLLSSRMTAMAPVGASPAGWDTMVVAVPSVAADSHVLKATWGEVLPHIAERLRWQDPELGIAVVDLSTGQGMERLADAKVVYAMNVVDEGQVNALVDSSASAASFVAINSSAILESRNRVLHHDGPSGGFLSFLKPLFRDAFGDGGKSESVLSTMRELYSRRSADDLLYSFLVYFNAASRPVTSIINSTKRSDAGLKEAMCMVKNCGKEILDCVTDDSCSKGLNCLNTCAFNDQVCSYLCISSYESEQFQKFSLCILQKHNCLGLSASIPENPKPRAMKTFRGAPMTHDLAEQLFLGWLDPSLNGNPRGRLGHLGNLGNLVKKEDMENFSWRVFAGQNAAFDRFPCQYQLFYPGRRAKNSFWYRPVFKVDTLDGKTVWRERLYRVRRQPVDYRSDGIPVFRFSVLDNGVTSLEDWTVLACDEAELEWCVFAYAGAASRAGMSYSGAILASRDGNWPTDKGALGTIRDALEQSSIKMWELYDVDNTKCSDFNPDVTALPLV